MTSRSTDLIRRLTPDDADTYIPLRLEGLTRAPQAFGRTVEEFQAEPLERVTAWLRGGQDRFSLGAFRQGALIGVASFVREGGVKTRHKGVVVAVYVSADARGAGVGKALMTELITQARGVPDLERLSLAVSTTQAAARGLYRALGFRVIGVEEQALKLGSEYVDEELMVLDLRSPLPG